MRLVAGFLAAFACASIAAAQVNYNSYSGFTTPTTPILPAVEKHPSLFFDSTQLTAVRARKSNTAYATLWSRITSRINSYKTKSVLSQDENDRPRMARYCAFAWIMNGDVTARDTAISALMAAYTGVPQTASTASFSDAYDEIYRATWIQNYCSAYDWVEDQLTPAQRDTIRRRIATEANLLCDNMRSGVKYSPRPHNHRTKPAYGLGTAALTLTGHPNAARWLDSALTNINTVTKYQFSADGIYREGSHYYIYTLVNTIPFLWHYKNVSSVDLFPYYAPSFEWPVFIRDQRGWMPNHEDGLVKPAPTHMVAAAYRTTPTRLHSTAPLSDVLQWNWATTSFFTIDYTGATNDICWDIDEFLLWDSTIPTAVPDAGPTTRLASGQIAFRNKWSGSDSSARYLFFHAVAGCDNHDHEDALSYIVNARNTCMAVDAGYGQDQSNYDTWYKQPLANNIVTINGSAPVEFFENVDPKDVQYLVAPQFEYAEKEAKTSAAGGIARRGIAFIDGNYWIVVDNLAATNASTNYKLNIHGRGTMSRTGNLSTWSIPSDSKYGSAANLHTAVFPATATFADRTGTTCLFKDSVPQTYTEATLVADTVAFLHLLWTTKSGEGIPAITDMSNAGMHAFAFSPTLGNTDQASVRRGIDVQTSGALRTDARFAWTRTTASRLRRYSLIDATFLDWNGATVVSADGMITLAASFVSDTLFRMDLDSINGARVVRVAVANAHTVTLNGTPIVFTDPAPGMTEFSVSEKGTVLISSLASNDVAESGFVAPSSFTLLPLYPNPFNPSVTIEAELPVRDFVSVKVYSLLGGLVRSVWEGELAAGRHRFRWDGRDGNDREAASGVYIVELRRGVERRQVKGLLLR